jgi:hypothetical protein
MLIGSQNWRLLTGSNKHPNTGTDTQWSVRRICIKSDDKDPIAKQAIKQLIISLILAGCQW